MGQKIRIITNKNRDKMKPKGTFINKNSIGSMWIDGVLISRNLHKLPTNGINFDREMNPNTKKKIFIQKR